jgi:AmmeMemoRadiSam system protein B
MEHLAGRAVEYRGAMRSSAYRPTLRRVDTFFVPDDEHGRVLVLRDMDGVNSATACVPLGLVPIVARFTGALTCAQIARDVSADLGRTVTTALVQELVDALEKGLFLEGPAFRSALEGVRKQFREAAVRSARHAGGAYPADAAELVTYLDERCLNRGLPPATSRPGRALTALVAPHIDPGRGAVGYGHAYAALRDGVAEDADTFIVFGTSHAPMREPFALCRKGFDTPLGPVPADLDAIDRLAASCPYDPYTDELNHKQEHSIEFQAVFLKHVLGDRPARIIPILAGLGRQQADGIDPESDAGAMALLRAVKDLVEERGRRAVVVAGADLAHVGPRFGDKAALGPALRADLARKDAASLELAARGEAAGFWRDVVSDVETRRVCGLSAMYAMLRTMKRGSTGEVLHYEQSVDPDDGSIVSHAALAFHA